MCGSATDLKPSVPPTWTTFLVVVRMGLSSLKNIVRLATHLALRQPLCVPGVHMVLCKRTVEWSFEK